MVGPGAWLTASTSFAWEDGQGDLQHSGAPSSPTHVLGSALTPTAKEQDPDIPFPAELNLMHKEFLGSTAMTVYAFCGVR